MKIYSLGIEDLSSLGGPMGTEDNGTTIRYRYFYSVKRAQEAAEKHYGKKITWHKRKNGSGSEDLGWMMYEIEPIKVER